WVIASFVITISVPNVQTLNSERGERRRRAALEHRRKIETFHSVSLRYVVHHANADWETTGLQVFQVRKRWWGWWCWFGFLGTPYQARVAKLRLSATSSSGIRWTEGKGIIGKCWRTRSFECVNLETHFGSTLTEGKFAALSDANKLGLTFEDYEHLKNRYGFVAAAPILDDSDRYLGCVSMDMPPVGWSGKQLKVDEVRDSLISAAHLIREVL
ncbi:MAG: hypothetical protein AB7F99_05275, partial [Vicinamibacterales bacterium]